MNNLSYRAKLLLMASLFVVPLALVAGRLAMTFHDYASQAAQTRNALNYLRDASELIRRLENLRDSSVISFVNSGTVFDVEYAKAKTSTDMQISQLKNVPALSRHTAFLDKLTTQIKENRISPGSEAARIEIVYQNAHSLVEQVYLWRLKLSYEFLSKSNTFGDVIAILDIVNNSTPYFHVLGETRALGSFYLQQGFIDSLGIERLDGNYLTYSRLFDNLEVRQSEYEKIFGTDANGQLDKLRNQLQTAQQLLDDNLLQVMTIESDPKAFYNAVSEVIAAYYSHNLVLLDRADTILREKAAEAERGLMLFYILASITTLLAGYLYIGFFTNVRITIRDLVHSAKDVANGRYEKAIEISSKDELQELAGAMDEMRLKLKMREEELTRVGQTDGLTQLKNRTYFNEMIPAMLSSCQRNGVPMCLVMMDIDHFKSINDLHGHLAGDICIQKAAKAFREQFKRKTDVVARYGGEEFIAILYGSTLAQAMEQTELLRKQVETLKIDIGSCTLTITASFGVAALKAGDLVQPEVLIGLCDTMLYKAKEQGRNRTFGKQLNLDGDVKDEIT